MNDRADMDLAGTYNIVIVVCRASLADIGDCSIGRHGKTQAEKECHAARIVVQESSLILCRRILIRQPIAGLFDAFHVCMRLNLLHPGTEKGGPVIGHHLLQCCGQTGDIVRSNRWRTAAVLREKQVEEILDAFPVAGFRADGRIDVQPQQDTLVIIIGAAPPVGPAWTAPLAEHVCGCCRVFHRAPFAAARGFHFGSCQRDGLLEMCAAEETAACSENVALVLGQALVSPQQVVSARRGKIASRHRGRPAVFAIPRMGQFMRDDIGPLQPGFDTVDPVSE